MGISAIVLALNVEDEIECCLKSLQWCDEVIVVDSFSEDDTVEKAKSLGAKVIQRETEGGFDELRNVGIEEASNNWIFVLDSDEICPKSLADKLLDIKNSEKFDAVKIPRKNYFAGKWKFYDAWPDYQTRFYKKDIATYSDKLHDFLHIEEECNVLELEAEEDYAIEHFPYRGVGDRLSKLDRDTTIQARQSNENGELLKAFFQVFKQIGKNVVGSIMLNKGYKRGKEALVDSLFPLIYIIVLEFKKWQFRSVGGKKDLDDIYNGIKEKRIREYDRSAT